MWNPLELFSRVLHILDRHRGGAALAAAVFASAGLYSLGSQASLPPLRQGLELTLGTLQTGVSGAMTLLNVWIWKENHDLKAALVRERLDRLQFSEAQAENQRLRS